LGLVDPSVRRRWMIDCTPSFPGQLKRLDASTGQGWGLDGIFLTHAHIGHYVGLVHLGREVMGAGEVPVYCSESMAAFIRGNEPWRQLELQGRIRIRTFRHAEAISLGRIGVTPLSVPHRDELSDTFAFLVEGPSHRALFLPDIDSWEAWDTSVVEIVSEVDYAWLDGTFFDSGEIPHRDLSEISHPFVADSMERLSSLPRALRSRVRFTHLNHSNPLCLPGSDQACRVLNEGFLIAEEGERLPL
jgi:pyrroloquinoline quinone biosynthesis protein B